MEGFTALVSAPPNRDAFAKVFNRLAVALREKDVDGAMMRVYYDALKDTPIAAIEAGAAVLMKEPGRRFFPTTAEWCAAADLARQEQLRRAIKPARSEPWRLECERCEDTGFVVDLTCPGDATCGRERHHAAHSYTKSCPCRPMNRTYQRHQRFGAGE